MKAEPDPIYDFIVGADYSDGAVAKWSALYPAHAEAFREVAMSARLDRLEDEAGPAFIFYLPPDPNAESHCWD